MKIAALDNPVRASWLAEQGYRLDAGPYVSEAYAARMFLNRLPRTEPLRDVTESIFYGGRARRQWTHDPDYGVPFLGSADIFEADLSHAPMITRGSFDENTKLALKPGWTLVTRSGMTAGRVTYSRLSMDGSACSEHVIRAVPDRSRIPAGYLYTCLASRFGIPMIKGGIFGTSVRHIEVEHMANIPVPRFEMHVESKIDDLIFEAMELRQRFEDGVCTATRDLFESAGIPELLDLRWHDQPRDINFSITGIGSSSIRALNFAPRARHLLHLLSMVPHRTLGEICQNGRLRTGARFKRFDASPDTGVRLIGQRQAFWLRPEGRWINPKQAPSDIMQDDETILIAAHGTLGDGEVYSRSIFVTGSWLKHAFSQDFVRVLSGSPDVSGAYLFAFFRSEAAFRVLRSMSVGGKQQEYHPALLRQLPVPMCTPSDRERIAETVRAAYRDRDEADKKEDQAFKLLDDAVREAAR
ncbi:hypothetical protein OHA21_52655 [Actinoplanes sp. NBC_00393]|uniref:methylation-associated defense system restriction endonuclease subunit S MAD5 n=1 Tax=Actinoplanes sp. NBC_00393 TaxID=2975953 RepID=UPI002E22C378